MARSPGAEGDFPWLEEDRRMRFPDPREAADGVVGVGANLSPGVLLSAYEQGIFPWYSEGEPIIWHSPDPRFVILPGELHVSESMRKVLKRGEFEIRVDTAFPAVIQACSEMERPGQDGTWITPDMIAAYCRLHELGYAHSAEAWRDGVLVGGCYGVLLGAAFFGESMFAREPNASKAAFLSLAGALFGAGLRFIDCQVHTDHLESLGARLMPRVRFLDLLREGLRRELRHPFAERPLAELFPAPSAQGTKR